MDWGIVVSVMVAMALFTVTVGILILMVTGLFVWRMKRHARSAGGTAFKLPDCCEMIKSARSAQ